MIAIILCNVGTPLAPDPKSVEIYLKEFLMDPNIVTLPWIIRYPLVNWVIAPRRAHSSAEKYQSIWTDRGSPLMYHSVDLIQNLTKHLPENIVVRMAMSCSEPSFKSVFYELAEMKIKKVLFVPLFPQFAQATTGAVRQAAQKLNRQYSFQITEFPPFYDEDFFIDSTVDILQEELKEFDHLLFSYHGLPVSQIKQQTTSCLQSENCCEQKTACLNNCYRAQCLRTTQAITAKAKIDPKKTSFAFQSRLGPVEWIKPYTDETIANLAKQGISKLAVICPSFVTDCIETLEEIGIEGKNIFLKNGGKEFQLISCLNSHPTWSLRFSEKLKQALDSVDKLAFTDGLRQIEID